MTPTKTIFNENLSMHKVSNSTTNKAKNPNPWLQFFFSKKGFNLFLRQKKNLNYIMLWRINLFLQKFTFYKIE